MKVTGKKGGTMKLRSSPRRARRVCHEGKEFQRAPECLQQEPHCYPRAEEAGKQRHR